MFFDSCFPSLVRRKKQDGGVKPPLPCTFCGSSERAVLAVEEFFEEQAGEAAGMVADDAVFFEEIVEDDAEAELLERRKIDGYRFGALRAIAAGHIGRHRLAIGDDPIDDAARDMLLDRAKMIGKGVASGFARLSHQIGDIHARSSGFSDGAGNFWDQQVRENAGVKLSLIHI